MIRLAPNVADSYQTMALIHEALDQPQKALDFMLIAAHMGSKSDAEPWRRLATQSLELKNFRQAIYCLSRVCKFDLNDVDARWDRAVLLGEIGDARKAALAFEGLRKMRPDDVEVVKNLARLYHQMQNPCAARMSPGCGARAACLLGRWACGASGGAPLRLRLSPERVLISFPPRRLIARIFPLNRDQATEVVESFIRTYPQLCDLTLVNILAELYISGGRYADTIQLVVCFRGLRLAPLQPPPPPPAQARLTSRRFAGAPRAQENAQNMLCDEDAPLPLDLLGKAAVSMLNLGQAERAAGLVATLRAASPAEYFDLFRDVAEAYWAQGDARAALELLAPLRAVEECDAPALWERIAACHVRLGDVASAVEGYEAVLRQFPGHPEALAALAKLLPQLVRRPLRDPLHVARAASADERLVPVCRFLRRRTAETRRSGSSRRSKRWPTARATPGRPP